MLTLGRVSTNDGAPGIVSFHYQGQGRRTFGGGGSVAQASPCRRAKAAAAARLSAWVLIRMWATWLLTVRSLTPSAAAISRLVRPAATSWSTSTSRVERPAGEG